MANTCNIQPAKPYEMNKKGACGLKRHTIPELVLMTPTVSPHEHLGEGDRTESARWVVSGIGN